MKIKGKIKNLWGGAYNKLPKEAVFKFTSGKDVYKTPPYDLFLAKYDLWASKAHCLSLYKQKIIDRDSAKAILSGLEETEKLLEKGEFKLDPKKEDIHTNIESYLTEKIGIEKAGKLHTARSRNDQVAVATRLFVRDKVLQALEEIFLIVSALVSKAKEHKKTVMPGFTHHQHAMPTSFSHFLLLYAFVLLRDAKRFLHWFDVFNQNPLGAAAGFGTSFPIDQKFTSKLLGFEEPCENTLDPITNRWEAEAEYIFSLTIFLKHLSSLSQSLIIFSTPEFSFVSLPEEYTTGSSIMPQKKNPDILEVVKGKSAYLTGLLTGLLDLSQASFFGYNRDSQWSKYMLVQASLEVENIGKIFSELIRGLKVNKEKMKISSSKAFITATNLLENICFKYKIPFRVGKILIEKSIKYTEGKDKIDFSAFKKAKEEMGLEFEISKKEFLSLQKPEDFLKKNKSLGGPGEKAVKIAVQRAEKQLEFFKKALSSKKQRKRKALKECEKLIKSLS